MVLITHKPGMHSTNGLWAYKWNLVKIYSLPILIIIILSGHNFARAMTALLSWHVQNCDLIWSIVFLQEQYKYLRDLDYELINVCKMFPDMPWPEVKWLEMEPHELWSVLGAYKNTCCLYIYGWPAPQAHCNWQSEKHRKGKIFILYIC